MTITITEKEHWKRRIEAKIDRRIEKLKSNDKPLFESIDEKAKQAAVAELGIEKEHSRYEKAGLQIRTLTKQREDLEAEMFNILFKDDAESHYYYKSRVSREWHCFKRPVGTQIPEKSRDPALDSTYEDCGDKDSVVLEPGSFCGGITPEFPKIGLKQCHSGQQGD